jgi:hypothetical protein
MSHSCDIKIQENTEKLVIKNENKNPKGLKTVTQQNIREKKT